MIIGGKMDNAKSETIISDIVSKDIIDLLDLGNLPSEKQEEYRKLAVETVNDRSFSRLTDILEEKGLLDEFQNVEETEGVIREFLTKNDIDLDNLIAEEAVLYKAQMKSINDAIMAGLPIKPTEN